LKLTLRKEQFNSATKPVFPTTESIKVLTSVINPDITFACAIIASAKESCLVFRLSQSFLSNFNYVSEVSKNPFILVIYAFKAELGLVYLESPVHPPNLPEYLDCIWEAVQSLITTHDDWPKLADIVVSFVFLHLEAAHTNSSWVFLQAAF